MKDWKAFFNRYRIIKIESESDLLYQVGASVGGRPISARQRQLIVESIVRSLELSMSDNILDLCCGNGVLTKDLGLVARTVLAIDASAPYIVNAKKFNDAPNIKYIVGDAAMLEKHIADAVINKVVWYNALAYFDKAELINILSFFNSKHVERVFIGDIPDKSKKWKFYDTLTRKLKYLILNNSGIGKWWSNREIETIAERAGFKYIQIPQSPESYNAHYRSDCVLIRCENALTSEVK